MTSFSAFALTVFSEECRWARTGLAVLAPPADPEAVMRRIGNSAFHMNAPYVTADNLQRTLNAVATVNDADKARAFLDMGAQGIITDHPDLL